MSIEETLKKKLDEMGNTYEEFKKANDAVALEVKKFGTESAASKEKLEKFEKGFNKLEGQIEELKTAIARSAQAPQTETEVSEKEAKQYLSELTTYMKKGVALSPEMQAWAKKAMSTDDDENGGFLVSPTLSNEIVKAVNESTPIRQLASVTTISGGSFEIIHDLGRSSSGWVGEIQPRPQTGTPQIKKTVIPIHEIYSEPAATQTMLDDAAWNVESFLSEKVTEDFSLQEAIAFVKGDGVNKPKGILSYDAGVGFGKLERVETAANTGYTGDDLIELQEALKDALQRNASWLMNRQVRKLIRKLKSNDNQYLWVPGLTAGAQDTLLGKPVYLGADLPSSIVAGADTLIYGDFKQGYQIVDRTGIRVIRDNLTAKPYILFYTTKRVGAGVKNFEALKIGKVKA